MVALPAVPKVIRVDLFFTDGVNSRVRDRIFFQYSGAGPSLADVGTFLSTVNTAWSTNLSSLQASGCNLTSLEGTDLSSASSPQFVATGTASGTAGGIALPAGVAAVVRFKISRRYRGGHPRFYFCGIETVEGLNTISPSSTFISNLASGFGAFITACKASPPASMGTVNHVNVSYFQGFSVVTNPISHRARNVPTIRPGGPVVDTVIGYTVNPNYGSQRRRYMQSA